VTSGYELSVRAPTVLRAPRELDAHHGGLFSEELATVPAEEPLQVDCRDVVFADSMGLRCLIKARRRHEEAGATFELLHVGDPLRRVLEVAGLLSIFDIVPNGDAGA
jgi:anti-anti-sigma factor